MYTRTPCSREFSCTSMYKKLYFTSTCRKFKWNCS